MAVEERRRSQLYQRLAAIIGHDEAGTMFAGQTRAVSVASVSTALSITAAAVALSRLP